VIPRHAVTATLAVAVGLALAVAALVIWWHFDRDIERARVRIANGSVLVSTRCGGQTWVGHDAEVRSEIVKLLLLSGSP
jgi:hypothetical protein